MENCKIAVVSDSHDNVDNLKKVIEISNKENCSHLFHLGDIVSPLCAQNLREFNGEVTAVFGNCDGDKIELNRIFNNFGAVISKGPVKLILKNRSFVLMHEPFLIKELIISKEIDYILYGHTHESEIIRSGKNVVLNPGESAGIKNGPSFFILDTHSDNIEKFNL